MSLGQFSSSTVLAALRAKRDRLTAELKSVDAHIASLEFQADAEPARRSRTFSLPPMPMDEILKRCMPSNEAQLQRAYVDAMALGTGLYTCAVTPNAY